MVHFHQTIFWIYAMWCVFVWREGIVDWIISTEDPWFESWLNPPEPVRPKFKADKSMGELIGLCRGIIADEKVNKEVCNYRNGLRIVRF